MSSPRPITAISNGRNEAGRFAPGHAGGPGRPRRPDLFAAAQRVAEAEGIDLRAAVGRVAIAMLALAEKGDVQAAKWVAEHLSVRELEEGGGMTIHIVTGVPAPEQGASGDGIEAPTSSEYDRGR